MILFQTYSWIYWAIFLKFIYNILQGKPCQVKILYLFINNPKRVVSTKGGSWFMYCVVTRIIIFFQGYLYGAIAYYKEKNDSFQIFFLWSVNANARIETQNSIHFYNHNTVTGCLYYLEVVWWIFARMRYSEINVMCTIQH